MVLIEMTPCGCNQCQAEPAEGAAKNASFQSHGASRKPLYRSAYAWLFENTENLEAFLKKMFHFMI